METKAIKRSPIQVDSLSLQNVEFRKESPRLRSLKVRPASLEISVTVQRVDELTFSTACKITINEKKKSRDFYFCAEYLVISKTLVAERAEDLERFARLGAPFNVLVHVRDILQSLSTRAYGKSVQLPLLDISEMASIAVTKVEAADDGHPPTSLTQEEPGGTK